MDRCSKCQQTNKEEVCIKCIDNPIYINIPRRSYYIYQPYQPVCPYGYEDCICDPGYIHYYYPDWYKDLYGNLTPKEAVLTDRGCMHLYNENKEWCKAYDDEDK